MTFRYEGCIAVVSGASSGLGRSLSLALADRGAVVVGVARRADLLDSLVVELKARSGCAERISCDVADGGAWDAVLSDVHDRHGRVDLLINAAAIERRRGLGVVQWADVDQTMAINFSAAVRSTLAVLPGMLARDHGAIVNVSSDHGRAPGPGTPAYCASKAALSAFTESLAHEAAGTGVHLHVLYPGWVPTPLGQAAVDQGMPMPPRAVRRSEAEVAARTLRGIGGRSFEINSARLATLAPVARALAPPVYRHSMRRAGTPRT